MGGDYGTPTTVPACVRALSLIQDCHFILFGNQAEIEQHLPRLNAEKRARFCIVATEQVVGMNEKPSLALRKKQQSSLYRAINCLREGSAQACVSAGNTGAMLAIGNHLLHAFSNIDRPAVCTAIPTENGRCLLLDVGANVSLQAAHLYQFALMGSVLSNALFSIKKPRVALLNIGVEESKGSEQIKSAAKLLQADTTLNYIGFVEPDQLFFDRADVAVCDGFVGNIALKSAEGAARLIAQKIRAAMEKNNLLGLLAKPLLHSVFKQIDPARYNGASFLGLQKTLVKSHGSANSDAFYQALELAYFEARAEIPRMIREKLEKNQRIV